MKLIERLLAAPSEERMSLDEYAAELDMLAKFGGHSYLLGQGGRQGPPGVPSESAPGDFEGMVRQVYYRNGVVSAVMHARLMLFSEARFKFRNLANREMFGSPALSLLERPTRTTTAGDLLARFEQDASLAGNAYRIRIGDELHHARPDWMHIILGSNMADDWEIAHAPDARVVGYAFWPDRKYEARVFPASVVAHYAPIPDPLFRFRGMSWLTPILAEIDTDRQLTAHKAGFLERGATPSFAIRYPESVTQGVDGAERAKTIVEQFRAQHEGAANSWKALHLFGGADPVSIGSNLNDLDYRAVQGAGETRICAAGRVPASVVGVSEGLQGSALNAGNFGQARRQFGEQYAYPSWRLACEALAPLIQVPGGAELWYDVTDVAFLHEDAKDAAEVISTQASAIRQLIETGMDPDAAVRAVTGGRLADLLGSHTGLLSVQLQDPTKTSPSAQGPDTGVT